MKTVAQQRFPLVMHSILIIGCGSIGERHLRQRAMMLHGEAKWTWHESPTLERGDLFTSQAHAFLDAIEGKPTSLATFDEAVQTLKFNEAALQSAATSQLIQIT